MSKFQAGQGCVESNRPPACRGHDGSNDQYDWLSTAVAFSFELQHAFWSNDMELLDSHRASQAAETGQLTPRGQTSENASSADFADRSARASTSSGRSSLREWQLRCSKSSTTDELSTDSHLDARINSLPLAVRRSSMPDVISFAQFCKMAPPSPPLERKCSSSLDGIKCTLPKMDKQIELAFELPREVGSVCEEVASPTSQPACFEKQPSEVLRGQGTGFEILKPGSLTPMAPKVRKAGRRWIPSVGPLQKSSRTQTSSLANSWKLRKSQRSSVGSTVAPKSTRRNRISWLFHRKRSAALVAM